MRFSVDRANLVRACAHMNGVASMRTTIPILNNVLLKAQRGELIVTGTNLEMAVTVTVPAKIEEPGATTVDYQKLKTIADTAPEGAEILCDETGDTGRLDVRAARSKMKLLTLPAADFPMFGEPERPVRFTIKGAEFERLLSVAYACGDDAKIDYLSGIFLTHREGTLASIATNRYQLAYAEVPAPTGAEGLDGAGLLGTEDKGIIIPPAAIKVLRALISDDEMNIEIEREKLAASVTRGSMSIRFVSKLLDGVYPAFRRILPERKKQNIRINSDMLAAAIKRAMIAQTEKTNAIKIAAAVEGLTVSARSSEGYEASDTLSCEWSGDDIEIGFNSRFLLNSIAGLGAKEIVISPSEGSAGSRFDVPGDDGRFDVIMPMMI